MSVFDTGGSLAPQNQCMARCALRALCRPGRHTVGTVFHAFIVTVGPARGYFLRLGPSSSEQGEEPPPTSTARCGRLLRVAFAGFRRDGLEHLDFFHMKDPAFSCELKPHFAS